MVFWLRIKYIRQGKRTVGNTTVFHGRCSLFHTVGPDSLAELTCIFLVCDAYVANDT